VGVGVVGGVWWVGWCGGWCCFGLVCGVVGGFVWWGWGGGLFGGLVGVGVGELGGVWVGVDGFVGGWVGAVLLLGLVAPGLGHVLI
ncbi:hypothetical protein RA276_29580, partial [Pseudomonas syringae pv. tagetis]|uniref:hypothetical protein n=1 Tax=Pseudomonas syringae group genomosp. 7 TaxID=251699 RepID=UPI00376FF29B